MTWGSNASYDPVTCRFCGETCIDDRDSGLNSHEEGCSTRILRIAQRSKWIAGIAFAISLFCLVMAASAAWGGAHDGRQNMYTPLGEFVPEPHPPVTVDNGEIVLDTQHGPWRVALFVPDDHYMDVVFDNRLIYRPRAPERITFLIDGHEIIVLLDNGHGEEPDLMTVLPPPGYIAIPVEIIVEEDGHGVIEIHEYLGG